MQHPLQLKTGIGMGIMSPQAVQLCNHSMRQKRRLTRHRGHSATARGPTRMVIRRQAAPAVCLQIRMCPDQNLQGCQLSILPVPPHHPRLLVWRGQWHKLLQSIGSRLAAQRQALPRSRTQTARRCLSTKGTARIGLSQAQSSGQWQCCMAWMPSDSRRRWCRLNGRSF